MTVINIPKYHSVRGGYIFDEDYTYYSPRYNKSATIKRGYWSDGATKFKDIVSAFWGVHDRLTDDPFWDDGTPCTRWQSSTVAADILREEGHWFLDGWVKYATMIPYYKQQFLSKLRQWAK